MRTSPLERVQQRADERFVDIPVLQVLEEIAKVVRLVQQGRVQRIAEKMVEVFSKGLEEVVEEFKITPQEQFSQRLCEQSVDVSFPRVDDHVVSLMPHERINRPRSVSLLSALTLCDTFPYPPFDRPEQ